MTEVLGQFNYLQWKPMFQEEKPYYLYTDPPPGYPNANFATLPSKPEPVHDVRGREKQFNLDDNGFAFGHQVYPGSLQDLDEETVRSEYWPSLEEHLRKALKDNNAEIYFFDWRKRSSDLARSKYPDRTKVSLEDRGFILAPIKAVHVDQTLEATFDRVHRHAPHMVDQMSKKRIRIINV